ncbi:hypothetical protein [Kitasatospora sp. NPDC001683]
MNLDEQIAVLEAQALDTAGRFIEAAHDPGERKRLHAELVGQRNELNRLKAQRNGRSRAQLDIG